MALPTNLGTFQLYRGDAWSQSIEDVNDEDAPTNLTDFGSAFTCQLRTAPLASTAIDVTVGTTDAATGTLAISLTGTVTAGMRSDTYYGDLQVTGGPLDPLTLYTFQVAMSGDITRA